MLERITEVTPSCQTDHRTFSHTQQPHKRNTPTYANTIRSLQVKTISTDIPSLTLFRVQKRTNFVLYRKITGEHIP